MNPDIKEAPVNDMQFRATEDWADLEVRTEGDEGIVHGIAVPWDKPTRIDAHLTEEFAPGAFDGQMKRNGARSVFLARDHLPLGGAVLGKLIEMRNDSKGLYIEGRVSRTQIGEETLTLVRDGVLDRFSIGFVAGQNQRTADGTIRRVSAALREVAIVLNPAYKDAVLAGVRHAACSCAAGTGPLGHTEDEHREATRHESVLTKVRALPDLPPVPRSR